MKIGILTYHRAPNFGSVMQAHCMYRLLQGRFPDATIELIDLRAAARDRYHLRQYGTRILRRPWRWNSDYLPVCRKIIRDSASLSQLVHESESCDAITQLNDMCYDAIVVGSDTVWEVNEKPGKLRAPNPFFLAGLKGCVKLALAVSADQSQETNIEHYHKRGEICDAVDSFDFIAVRDEFTRTFLARMGSRTAREGRLATCADPTLLVNWSGFRAPLARGDTHLGHVVLHRELRKKVSSNAKSLGWQASSLYDRVQMQWNRRSRSGRDLIPSFLDPFRHVNFVVTDRFHASIFALLMREGPVVYLERAARYNDQLSKGRDLFRKLGIEEFVLRSSFEGDWAEFLRCASIQWREADAQSRVDEGLARLRDEGERTLAKAREVVVSHSSGKA